MNFKQININNKAAFITKNLILGFLFLSLFACKNEAKETNSAANKTIENQSIIKEKSVNSPSDKIETFLKEGKTGVFEDTCFTAIMGTNHAVFILGTAINNENDYGVFNYSIKSYTKNGDNWQVKDEQQVTSDSTNYKPDLPEIKLYDINKDGEKDIMLLMASDGRGNQQYTLFLSKDKGQTLVKVEGFEELYAPIYDAKKKVIVSTNSYNRGQAIDIYTIVNDSLQHLESKEVDYKKNRNEEEDK
jgi:hypothetical protein